MEVSSVTLNSLWFILIGILFCGFFVLEGFDFGVGILMPFIAKNDSERRVVINTIGPVWDGNEVWLLTAGGAMFAAFPNWYATLFSGFYLALFLMLVALIGRGVAFEFRSKVENVRWRTTWDWVIFGGSLLPPLLWGVAMADMMKGVPIDAKMNYVGTFWNLLSPYSIIGGLSVVLIFIVHGALFITLKTKDTLHDRANKTALRVGGLATLLTFLFVVLSYFQTDIFQNKGIDPGAIPILAGLALFMVRYSIQKKHTGWAFTLTTVTIALSTLTIFVGLFPRVMVSSLNPSWSLTIYNAASNPYTLKVMTIVALTLVPIVLAYQAWNYWIFRRRLTAEDHLDY